MERKKEENKFIAALIVMIINIFGCPCSNIDEEADNAGNNEQ